MVKKNPVFFLILFTVGFLISLTLSNNQLITAQTYGGSIKEIQETFITQSEINEIVKLVRDDILSEAPGVADILVVDSQSLIRVENYAIIGWYENAGGLYALRKTANGWKIIGAYGGVPYASDLTEYSQIPRPIAQKILEIWWQRN